MKFRTVIRVWFWLFAITSLLALAGATYFALHPAETRQFLEHIVNAPTRQAL